MLSGIIVEIFGDVVMIVDFVYIFYDFFVLREFLYILIGK